MNADSLGRGISEATKFLLTIHEDLRAQIRSLDRLMFDAGWTPAPGDKNCVGNLLGNSLNDGKQWVLDYIQRCYVPTRAGSTTDRVVALVWCLYFDTGDAYEQPTVAAVAARLTGPKPVGKFLANEWKIGDIFRAAGRSADPVPLAADQLDPFLPEAGPAAGLVLPLCELTNEEALQQRLVGPILAAEEGLGPAVPTGAPVS